MNLANKQVILSDLAKSFLPSLPLKKKKGGSGYCLSRVPLGAFQVSSSFVRGKENHDHILITNL